MTKTGSIITAITDVMSRAREEMLMGYSPYTRTRPPDLSQAPRCEAWNAPQPNRSKPPAQCTNAGLFERDGHRVCMMHKNSKRIAFNAEAAEQLPPSQRR